MLVSNSTAHGSGYLDRLADGVAAFLGPTITRVLFVPYALFDRDAYAARVRARFEALGYGLDSVHDARDGPDGPDGPARAVERADAIFIGGGNTFRLLDALWRES